MARVTGVLSDFGIARLDIAHPSIVFQPSGAAVSDGKIMIPECVIAYADPVSGAFEVDIQPSGVMNPAVTYSLTLQWGQGQRVKLPWKLSVPTLGGRLGDLLNVPSDPANAWVGETPPPNPTPGVWWYNPTTGVLAEWSA